MAEFWICLCTVTSLFHSMSRVAARHFARNLAKVLAVALKDKKAATKI